MGHNAETLVSTYVGAPDTDKTLANTRITAALSYDSLILVGDALLQDGNQVSKSGDRRFVKHHRLPARIEFH